MFKKGELVTINSEEKKIVLIDMETGEMLAETPQGIKKWLTAYEEYTLEIV